MSCEAWGEPDDSPYEAAIEAGWINPDDLSKALLDMINERQRQVDVEKMSPDDDDAYTSGQLAWAAICYLQSAAVAAKMQALILLTPEECAERSASLPVPEIWPWSAEWWKPSNQRRDLEKAVALIIAEMERLDRAAEKAAQP